MQTVFTQGPTSELQKLCEAFELRNKRKCFGNITIDSSHNQILQTIGLVEIFSLAENCVSQGNNLKKKLLISVY